MKQFFTRLFWFVLERFEKGDGPYSYKSSSRTILLVVGLLFSGLSAGSLYFSIAKGDFSAFLPIIVFLAVGGCLSYCWPAWQRPRGGNTVGNDQ